MANKVATKCGVRGCSRPRRRANFYNRRRGKWCEEHERNKAGFCAGQSYDHRFGYTSCSRRNGLKPDKGGLLWCSSHHPERVTAREARRQEWSRLANVRQDAQMAMQTAEARCMAVCVQMSQVPRPSAALVDQACSAGARALDLRAKYLAAAEACKKAGVPRSYI
jgi:hypothetical protein